MSLTIVNQPGKDLKITSRALEILLYQVETYVASDMPEGCCYPTQHLFMAPPGIRISVSGGGCLGFSYLIEKEGLRKPGEFPEGEVVVAVGGLLIYIDNTSLPYVKGLTIDYVQEGLQSSFKFHKPNAAGICGCGISFTV